MLTMVPATLAFSMACAACLIAKAVPLTFVPSTRSQSVQAALTQDLGISDGRGHDADRLRHAHTVMRLDKETLPSSVISVTKLKTNCAALLIRMWIVPNSWHALATMLSTSASKEMSTCTTVAAHHSMYERVGTNCCQAMDMSEVAPS